MTALSRGPSWLACITHFFMCQTYTGYWWRIRTEKQTKSDASWLTAKFRTLILMWPLRSKWNWRVPTPTGWSPGGCCRGMLGWPGSGHLLTLKQTRGWCILLTMIIPTVWNSLKRYLVKKIAFKSKMQLLFMNSVPYKAWPNYSSFIDMRNFTTDWIFNEIYHTLQIFIFEFNK